MENKNILATLAVLVFVLALSGIPAYASLTVVPSLPGGGTITESEQASVSVSVTNTGNAENNIIVRLVSSPSWFSMVSDCPAITSLQKDQSAVSSCIITPTGTGSGLGITATATSAGGTEGSGQVNGITVNSASSSLATQISSDSSVQASSTFFASVTVIAPSSADSRNVITTASVTGGCSIDTSYVSASQNIGNITKSTSKSPASWKVTAPSSAGTCVFSVSVASDNTGSASPTKSITITGSGGNPSSPGSSTSSTSSSASGGAVSASNATQNKTSAKKSEGSAAAAGVPPGLANNTKLLGAIEKVLAKGKLSESAVANLERLAGLIKSDVTVGRTFKPEEGKSVITEKIKYSGAKKVRNFMVHAKLPKEFAAKASDIAVSATGTVETVENDPEFLITFAEALPGQEFAITYTVNAVAGESALDSASSQFYAESLEDMPAQPSVDAGTTGTIFSAGPTMPIIIILLAAFAAGVFLIRKRVSKEKTKREKAKKKHNRENKI